MSENQPVASTRARKQTGADTPVTDSGEVTPAEVPVVVEPVTASANEPVVATDDPAAVEIAAPVTETGAVEPVTASEHRIVYVETPRPPRKKGNRGVGALFAVISALVFAVLYAVLFVIVSNAIAGTAPLAPFLQSATFFIPVIYFALGFVVLVLIANRANWWAYVVGSLLVAVFVYFASTGTLLLTDGIIAHTPDEAAQLARAGFASPIILSATLLAREVALWVGAAIAARGRRVKARNVVAREEFERELAEQRSERVRGTEAEPVATA
jgi:hypothetical protein